MQVVPAVARDAVARPVVALAATALAGAALRPAAFFRLRSALKPVAGLKRIPFEAAILTG